MYLTYSVHLVGIKKKEIYSLLNLNTHEHINKELYVRNYLYYQHSIDHICKYEMSFQTFIIQAHGKHQHLSLKIRSTVEHALNNANMQQ